jgi:aqualysin 1
MKFTRFAWAVLGVTLFGTQAFGQRQAALPVIVTFEENARLEDFAGSFVAEERMAADPQAWGYLNRGVVAAVQALERRGGFKADHVYSHSIRGFAARLSANQIQQLENDSLVSSVEPDGTMSIITQTTPWGIDKIDADQSSTQAGNGSGAVSNVRVYIIDTGIAVHADLNLVSHVNFAVGQNTDCHGHGTHVAGTAAARDNTSDVVGVAPGAPLYGVKVLGCNGSGSTSGVIKGVDHVAATATLPAVANMSLGGGASTALDNAVKNVAAKGVLMVVAAGNSGANACNYSPARAGTTNGVVTVAATDAADKEASFSNYGNCVDIWGPGVSILSTRRGGGTTTMSGTSMASPHGAGAGALYLSGQTGASPATAEAALKSAAVTTANKSKDNRTITRLNVASF